MWKQAIVLDKATNFSGFQSFDKRLNSPFITGSRESDFKILLQYVDQIKIDNNNLHYFTPNNVALFFSLAEKSTISAKNYLSQIHERIKLDSHKKTYDREVLVKDSKLVCDYLEQVQSAIVFSFTAIESFTNISIPFDYNYEIKSNKKTEIYNKVQIERWIDWKTKISKILVEIYNVEKIENQSFWLRFLDLVELRNNIIHQKSTNDTKHLENLFETKVFEICSSANELFTFFIAKALDRFEKDTMMVGNENLWPSIITYIPDMPINQKNNFLPDEI